MDDLVKNDEEVRAEGGSSPETASQLIRKVKRYGRRRVPAEVKIQIVMEGLRGEESISDLCRREGINKAAYYRWLKSFLEGGKKRLQGDLLREANADEVRMLREENESLKRLLAETVLENHRLKKSHLE